MVRHDVPDKFVRHSTAEAIAAVASRFDLPNHSHMQDWDLEAADPTRLGEFLDELESSTGDENYRFTLMTLVVASLDAAKEKNMAVDRHWRRVAAILKANASVHADTIWYWSCGDSESPDELFRISLEMRAIRRAIWGR